MAEVITAAQMRSLEQVAIARGSVSALELMERAGQGVVGAVYAEWPEFSRSDEGVAPAASGVAPAASVDWGPAPKPPRYLGPEETRPLRAVVLCGPGNNGGDGFVVARLLAARGWDVTVYLYGDAEALPPDALVNYQRWCALGGVHPLLVDSEIHSDLIVDALFGTGLTRGLPDLGPLFLDLEDMVDRVPRIAGQNPDFPKVVSVDLPSGLCADSGRVLGVPLSEPLRAACAHLTVTFHAPKPGHYLADGLDACGRVVVCDIGLSEQAKCSADDLCQLVERPHPSWLRKEADAHKFIHGSALVLTGGAGRTGAARLAARGALRVGAGLVTLGVPPAAQMEVALNITALMLTRVADADALAEVLKDVRINAVCGGPGLGLERARDLVPAVLTAAHRPAVCLDADALSAYADAPEALFAMLHTGCVLTPHGGEFARLFPDIAERLNAVAETGPAYSKVDAARDAAGRAGCTVLFKGVDTVIANPDGRCSIHAAVRDRAAPWLATAGAGDVLAGFITGLMARGMAPMQAAETATWLHVECARSFGPGLIAEDLPEELPKVLSDLSGL